MKQKDFSHNIASRQLARFLHGVVEQELICREQTCAPLLCCG